MLKKTKFNFMLSYDNHEFIRKLYKGFNFYDLTWFYNTANLKGKKRDHGSELIITNYKMKNAQLFE